MLPPRLRTWAAVGFGALAGAAGRAPDRQRRFRRGAGPAVRPARRLGLLRLRDRRARRLDRSSSARAAGRGRRGAAGRRRAGRAVPLAPSVRVARVATGTTARVAAACRGAGVVCAARLQRSARCQPAATRRRRRLAVDDGATRCGPARRPRRLRRRRSRPTPFARRPDDQLLTGLRGKDVLLVFVESYGRVAVQDSSFSPGVDAVLDDGTRRLAGAGYSIAQRLPDLTDLRRRQLAGPLDAAVRPVGRQPAALRPAARQRPADPHRARSAGPAGAPSSTYRRTPRTGRRARTSTASTSSTTRRTSATRARSSATPRCRTSTRSEHFRRAELAGGRPPPVFAEIDLVSSHHPWAPLPPLVAWDEVGDGSVFDGMPEDCATRSTRMSDPDQVAGPTAGRSSTPGQPGLLRGDLRRRRPGAGHARRPPSRIHGHRLPTPATTSRSPSSRRTATSYGGSPTGVGRPAAAPAMRRCGRWTCATAADRLNKY